MGSEEMAMLGLSRIRFPYFLKKNLFLVVLILFVSILSIMVSREGRLITIDSIYYDLWHILAGPRAEPKHVAIVSIDNETLLQFRDEPLVFWGPRFAKGMEVLQKIGVHVIGLDYLFSTSAESWLKKIEISGGERSRTYDIPMRRQLATGNVVMIGWVAPDEKGGGEILLPTEDYLFALPNLSADVGLANFFADEDGVVRRFIPVLFDDGTSPALTFATLLAVKASRSDPLAHSWSLGGREVLRKRTPLRINFVGPPGTLPRLSFSRLLKPMAEVDPEVQRLKDKVVIIGSEHIGMQDVHLVPYSRNFLRMEGSMMSGVELHANIVETLLSGGILKPLPESLESFYVIGFLTLGVFLFFRLHPMKGLILGLFMAFFCAAFAYLFFLLNWILPVISLQMGLAFGYLGTLGLRLTKEERERKALRQMFGRYVSDEVVEKLVALGYKPDLWGESLSVSILFTDIRNFTTISQRLNPHQVVRMLNTYFSRVCEAIQSQEGTVDKFIGDAIMAVFGSPIPHPDHARRALRTALAIQEEARLFQSWMNDQFPGISLPPFEVGIGLHTGQVVVGNIGSLKRMEYTAIGDVVNTASRLEGLSKELGWGIVASHTTIEAAQLEVLTRDKRKVRLRGREEEIEVYEVIGLLRGGKHEEVL